MPYVIPARIPSSLTAGDTWQWTLTLPEYLPGQGYTATYQLVGKTSLSFTASPNVSLGNYDVSVAAATTATVGAGPYRWNLRVTDAAGVVHVVRSGHVLVLSDPGVTTGTDATTHAQHMLVLIESELEARVKGDGSSNVSYSIEGRSISKMTLQELYSLRGKYRGEVSRIANGGQIAPVQITFGNRPRGRERWWE